MPEMFISLEVVFFFVVNNYDFYEYVLGNTGVLTLNYVHYGFSNVALNCITYDLQSDHQYINFQLNSSNPYGMINTDTTVYSKANCIYNTTYQTDIISFNTYNNYIFATQAYRGSPANIDPIDLNCNSPSSYVPIHSPVAGLIIGISVGVIFFFILIICITVFVRRRRSANVGYKPLLNQPLTQPYTQPYPPSYSNAPPTLIQPTVAQPNLPYNPDAYVPPQFVEKK